MHSTLTALAPVFCQAFHPEQDYYAYGCLNGDIVILSTPDFKEHSRYHEATGCRSLAFRGNYIAYGLRDGVVVISSIVGSVEAFRLPPTEGGVSCLEWMNDNILVVGYGSGLMRIYNRRLAEPLKAEIREFTEPINDIKRHQDGDKFYACAGCQLGLFSLVKQDHGTRLLAMSDEMDDEIESLELFQGGRKIACACVDFGIAIFFEGDLGTHKDRLTGLRYPLHCILKLNEDFMLTGGETGQILLAQLFPNQWCGVFDDIKLEGLPAATEDAAAPPADEDDDSGREEDTTTLMAVDDLACDRNKQVVACVDNCHNTIVILSLAKAFEMIEGKSIGQRTAYAEFMEDL